MSDMRERWRAYAAVKRAIERGELVRPDHCSRCHKLVRAKSGQDQIQAHHYLGYAKRDQLKVQWLCPSCNNLAKEQEQNQKRPSKYSGPTASMIERLKAAKEGRK